MRESDCCMANCTVAISTVAIIYSFVVLAAERFWATLSYRSYEKVKSPLFMVVVVVVPVGCPLSCRHSHSLSAQFTIVAVALVFRLLLPSAVD